MESLINKYRNELCEVEELMEKPQNEIHLCISTGYYLCLKRILKDLKNGGRRNASP